MFLANTLKKRAGVLPFCLLFLMVFSCPAFGADTNTDKTPLTVKVGAFVTSIYDLSLTDDSFNIVFWLWAVFPEDPSIPYMPENTIGIMEAKSFERLFSFDDDTEAKRWVTVKFHAVLIHNWDMTDFPFDKQHLKIELEEAEFNAKNITFVPDTVNSGIDSMVNIPGWTIDGFSIESRVVIDETTYGDPTLTERSTFPQTVIFITLKREGMRLLFNLLTAAYIAFILGMMVLFLSPEYVNARKVVLTSALITIIGNHYIISAELPEMPTFTLVDRIMITTFIAICLCGLFSTITAHYVRVRKMDTAEKINRIARWSILVVYVILNVIFYLRAIAL